MIDGATVRATVVVALASVALCGCQYPRAGESRGMRVHVEYKPAWNLKKLGLAYSTDGGPLSARAVHPPDDTPLNPSSTTIAVILAGGADEPFIVLLIDGSDTRGVVAAGSVSLVVPARGFVEADLTLHRTRCDEETHESSAEICDDDNECTDDTCVEGSCVHQFRSTCQCRVDAECDDGLWCNGIETCDLVSHMCIDGTPPDCVVDASTCEEGFCNEDSDECVTQPRGDGSACDDGDPCTQGDSCSAGSCGGVPVTCQPLDECHETGVCNPTTGTCTNPAKPDNTPCRDDNNECTSDVCVSGECTHEDSGLCKCASVGDCDDGLWCNGQETCNLASRTCVAGNAPDCSGLASQCVDGVCDEQLHTCVEQQHANGSLCDDGNLCTRLDTCQSGSCVGELPVECDRLSDCHYEGVCNPQTGQCSNPTAPHGTACTSDGHDCTTGECSSGICIDACTCNDNRKNQGEEETDCGGPCPPCGGGGGPISTADFSLDKGCYAPGESVIITNIRDRRNGDDWWWQLPANGEEEKWDHWKDDSVNFPVYTLYDAPGSTGEYEMRYGPDDCGDKDYTSSLTFQVNNSCP